MEKIKIQVGWADKNYSACTDDFNRLNGIIIATSNTLEKLKKEFQSALQFHIECSLAAGDSLPEWLKRGEYELDYILEISALLHSLDGILTRSAISRVSGINERQIGHYASGIRTPRPAQREKIINGVHKISRELAAVM